MKRNFDKNKIVYDDGEMQLTEWDMECLRESEEDVKHGRVYSTEEVLKYLEKECGYKRNDCKEENLADNEIELSEWDKQQILKSEEDIEDGRIRNAREAFKELEDKYGF